MSRAGPPCFHCSEPIPPGIAIYARIGEVEQPVCCHGCKAVAEFITGAGLNDYYTYRDAAAARADETPRPDRWSAYDRPELVERLTRAEPGGARSITVLLEGMRGAACSASVSKMTASFMNGSIRFRGIDATAPVATLARTFGDSLTVLSASPPTALPTRKRACPSVFSRNSTCPG